MKEHSRTLIFDLDDTISFTMNRNWEHAVPNTELIQKSNDLYNKGWKIIIVTSRGNLSCSSREEADKKYREQIELWLKENNVLYDELSFEKKLGVFYIDDKALRPDEFIDMEIKEYSDGSWSDGKTLYIEDKDAFNTIKWYELAKKIGIHVPEIYSVTGKNISRESFKDSYKFYESLKLCSISNKLYSIIGIFKDSIEKMFRYELVRKQDSYSYIEYLDNLKNIIFRFENKEVYSEVLNNLQKFSEYNKFEFDKLSKMFYHGNLSIENLVYNSGKIYFLNPIVKNGYSNPVIDISTFCASLIYNVFLNEKNTIDDKCYTKIKRDIYSSLCVKWIDEFMFNNFIIAEFIRLYQDEKLTKKALLIV